MGRSALLKFFFITFAITWPCFTAVAAFSAGAAPSLAMLRGPILFLGIFAPSIVALSLTAHARGTVGVLALLRRLVQANVGARWYLFAVAYMASVKLIVALLHRLFLGAWPRFGAEAWYVMLAATVGSTIIGGQAGEEIGWRGFALPRLASRFGYSAGSIILGVIWALWHLPLFFVREADKQGQSFFLYTLHVTAISVAMAFLYQRYERQPAADNVDALGHQPNEGHRSVAPGRRDELVHVRRVDRRLADRCGVVARLRLLSLPHAQVRAGPKRRDRTARLE
ncbi:MAG TPA: type II CAAX endopeptidase family protein [Thermoanaerobaculia bacterium]|jgi:membrane protease YdiL (CAAX protease family)|nr:type II CAAX endopeptidase family protein [Thermoanaerobaculia bacterium]